MEERTETEANFSHCKKKIVSFRISDFLDFFFYIQ